MLSIRPLKTGYLENPDERMISRTWSIGASTSMARTWGRGTMISLMGREPMSRMPEIIRRLGDDMPRTPEPSRIRTSSSPIPLERPSGPPRAKGNMSRDRNERTRTRGLKTVMSNRMGWMNRKAVLTGLWAA